MLAGRRGAVMMHGTSVAQASKYCVDEGAACPHDTGQACKMRVVIKFADPDGGAQASSHASEGAAGAFSVSLMAKLAPHTYPQQRWATMQGPIAPLSGRHGIRHPHRSSSRRRHTSRANQARAKQCVDEACVARPRWNHTIGLVHGPEQSASAQRVERREKGGGGIGRAAGDLQSRS